MPAGTAPSGKLSRERTAPPESVPADSRQLELKFDEACPESEMIMVFCASVGVGAIEIVGSITTGNSRAGWRSQAGSAVTVRCMVPVALSQVACWVTFGLQARPYGDCAAGRASVMNGFGMISTGTPPAPSRENAIDPSGRW